MRLPKTRLPQISVPYPATILPPTGLSALLQRDLDTANSGRYSLLMDAPRFSTSTVEEAIMMAEENHKWACLIRELDPTLSNDQHTKKRGIGEASTELNVSASEWKKGADIHDGQFS